MIAIVDYGMGNVGSILNMLKRVKAPAESTRDPARLRAAQKLILPGVGAFDTAMRHLNESGLTDVLHELVVERRTPTIGLCLGMQLLTLGSEEGQLPGLGWIEGRTRRFAFPIGDGANLKVPHMGWNEVQRTGDSALLSGLEADARFYFVHSYHVVCADPNDVAGWTHYGFEFASVIHRGHVMGTQFHPEKSHRFGMQLLRNFAGL